MFEHEVQVPFITQNMIIQSKIGDSTSYIYKYGQKYLRTDGFKNKIIIRKDHI